MGNIDRIPFSPKTGRDRVRQIYFVIDYQDSHNTTVLPSERALPEPKYPKASEQLILGGSRLPMWLLDQAVGQRFVALGASAKVTFDLRAFADNS